MAETPNNTQALDGLRPVSADVYAGVPWQRRTKYWCGHWRNALPDDAEWLSGIQSASFVASGFITSDSGEQVLLFIIAFEQPCVLQTAQGVVGARPWISPCWDFHTSYEFLKTKTQGRWTRRGEVPLRARRHRRLRFI